MPLVLQIILLLGLLAAVVAPRIQFSSDVLALFMQADRIGYQNKISARYLLKMEPKQNPVGIIVSTSWFKTFS
jgi:hypothetical protein